MLLGTLAIGVWSLPLHAAKLASPSPAPAPQLTPPAEPPPSELPKIVEQLAAQPALSAEDCARLARETLAHGQALRQSGQPVKPGVVQDGLAAVDHGERSAPAAADWPELRSQLQELLKPPPQQDEKKDEEKKDEEQKQDQQQKQEQQSKDRQDEQSPEQQQQDQQKSEQQQQQEQAEQQRRQDEQQQQQQPAPAEPPKEEQTQKIGGEKPEDAELREHPELAVPLQKLDQVRDQDSPAELFDRLNNAEPRTSDQPKRDW